MASKLASNLWFRTANLYQQSGARVSVALFSHCNQDYDCRFKSVVFVCIN